MSAPSRLPHVLLALYVACCLAALVWPVNMWVGDRLEPRILGVPPALAWTVAWVIATFVAVWLYDRALERGR